MVSAGNRPVQVQLVKSQQDRLEILERLILYALFIAKSGEGTVGKNHISPERRFLIRRTIAGEYHKVPLPLELFHYECLGIALGFPTWIGVVVAIEIWPRSKLVSTA